MKKENSSYFSNLFGAKGQTASTENTVVKLTSSSQPHVLRERMQEERLTHGETVAANISPVRLERNFSNEVVLYFCPMKKIEVLKVIADGDGGSLPADATLDGLSIPKDLKSGLYKICNVEITSNGTMQVKATSGTRWEKIEA